MAEGYRVVGIDDLSYGVREQVPDGVEFHCADVRSPDVYPLFDGVRAVFHLAAKNCISDCQADPVETASINVLGTANVFEAARRAGVPNIVHAESSALYEGTEQYPTPESAVSPQSFYARSKYAARQFAEAYAGFHGLNITALRYFNVYGPRQDYRRSIPPVMSAFIIHLLKGERPTIYGTGEKRRDFVYVDDVNRFHLMCLEDPGTGGRTFNIGSGTSHSVLEIFEMIRSVLGVDVEPQFQPDLPGEAQETRADITAARALGWDAEIDLEEGVRRSVAYIREHVVRPGVV